MNRRPLSLLQALSLLVIAALFISLFSVHPVHAEGITFADATVEKIVRLELAKPSGALTETDMASLKELTIPDYSQVKSLKGLETAINLTSLTFWGNQVTDLSPLSGMKQLRELNLNYNRVTSLAPLAGLNELRSLLVGQNEIKDIRPLAGLVKLTELAISQNPITDLSPLSTLTELTELSFDDTPVSNLTPISGLGKLQELSFYNSGVENLEPLSHMTSLVYITMRDNLVSDLSPIVGLPNLKGMGASNNFLDLNEPSTKAAIASLQARSVTLSDSFGSIQEQRKMTTNLKLKWSALDELHTGSSHSIAYGGGLYIMPAGGGYVKTSKDGLTWKQTYSGNPEDFSFIIHGKTDFIGFRRHQYENITVWTSKDGMAWKQNDKTIGTPYIKDAAWNGKRYVAVGGETSKGMIYSSEDGLTWTERKTGIGTNFTAVAWGNNTFVAQGYEGGIVAISKDGITWKKVYTNQPNSEQVWDMTFGGGAFVAVGDATIMTSKDGQKWTYVASKAFWSNVFWAKDRFYIYGFEYVDKANHVMKLVNWTAKDGKSWSDAGFVASPKQNPSITLHNGKQYVTITESGIEASTDGRSWKQTQLNPFQLPRNVYKAAVGNDKLVMVGGYRDELNFLSISFQGSAQMNSAGKWKSAVVGQTYPLRSVVWSGKDFFAVGDSGKMMFSADGLKWTAIKSPTSVSLLSVVYAKGTYYVAGENGLILSSKDRKTWTVLKTNVKKKINAIESNGKTLVAVGEEGLLLVSQDGVKWSQIPAKFPGDNFDVVWGNGQFVVTTASYYGTVNTAVILTSPDGKTWKGSSFQDSLSGRGMGTGFFGISYIGNMF
ncbi:MAG: leucine-rich repeat domain-containing protein, partial [Gorillibacterium sp.]|nr:leucine-rich repeat domain-containing protein [Gorillibacterium sp.]